MKALTETKGIGKNDGLMERINGMELKKLEENEILVCMACNMVLTDLADPRIDSECESSKDEQHWFRCINVSIKGECLICKNCGEVFNIEGSKGKRSKCKGSKEGKHSLAKAYGFYGASMTHDMCVVRADGPKVKETFEKVRAKELS